MTELNRNMLSGVGFTFHIKKTPELNEFVQSISIPGIDLGVAEQPNPFKSLKIPGDHITYSDMSVTFKINEDLGNYMQIFNWITALGYPDQFSQYKALADQDKVSGESLMSDGSVIILSSAKNPIIRLDFHDMFPTSLSPIDLNTRDSTLEYIEATATFAFKNYYFTAV